MDNKSFRATAGFAQTSKEKFAVLAFVLAVVVGMLITIASAGGTLEQQWVAYGPNDLVSGGAAVKIAVDGGGNVYIAGSGYGQLDTIKYNSAGQQLWAARSTSRPVARDLTIDAAGNAYVLGQYIFAPGGYVTIKYSTNGTQLWVREFLSPRAGDCFRARTQAHAIAVDNSGNVYVTGRLCDEDVNDGSDWEDYGTIKYDSNGNRIWIARYRGPAFDSDEAYDIAVDSSGDVYVTGTSFNEDLNLDYVTVKYRSSDGWPLWETEARYDYDGGDDIAWTLTVDEQFVYVTGGSESSETGFDYATIKYDAATGQQLWTARYDANNRADGAHGIAVDSMGCVYVTGDSETNDTSYDYATIKYDPNGNQLWVARYNGPINGSDAGDAIVLDADANVYVTGVSGGSDGTSDFATIKYDSDTGQQLWLARFTGIEGSQDQGNDIAVSDAGENVYVTGQTMLLGIMPPPYPPDPYNYYTYATIKYSLQYFITSSAGPNGTISPSGTFTVNKGDNQLFTATPNTGYTVDMWYLDGNLVQAGGNTYTLINITDDYTVYVTFISLPQYTVTASAGAHGSISPSGTIVVYYGDNIEFTATPNLGYGVDAWYLDSNSVQQGGTTYTLYDVQADHNVLVTFMEIPPAVYVNANSPNDPGTGTRNDPFRRIQDGINAAQACGLEVWVVAGTYVENITLGDGIAIYGGFVGNETELSQRDWNTNETIIDGNQQGSVVTSPPEATKETRIDGFIIRNGLTDIGGGMRNDSGNPTITNCTFSNNVATAWGGGMHNGGGNPTITNCIFSNNVAINISGGWGGGIHNSYCSPIVTDCIFIGNTAEGSGGGMSNRWYCGTVVTNCVFSDNTAEGGGGGIDNYGSGTVMTNCVFSGNSASNSSGGGILNVWYSHSTVTNCIFIGNTASDNGGGMYIFCLNSMTVTNCSFVGNSANYGGGMCNNYNNYTYPDSPRVTNCILWGNIAPNGPQIYNYGSENPYVTYSDVDGNWAGTGNINADPLFVGPNDLRLQAGSPCIDAGDNNSVPPDYADLDGDGDTVEPTPLDLGGFPRFIDDLITDDTGNGAPPIVDMGAYEFLRSDINGSGDVDFGDIALFGSQWLESGCGDCGGADLTGDGQVDWADMQELVEYWLAGAAP